MSFFLMVGLLRWATGQEHLEFLQLSSEVVGQPFTTAKIRQYICYVLYVTGVTQGVMRASFCPGKHPKQASTGVGNDSAQG